MKKKCKRYALGGFRTLASKKELTDEDEKDANTTWYINKGQAFITLPSFRNIASHQIGDIM